MARPRQTTATVTTLEPAGAYHRLVLAVDGIADQVLPGHFVAVAVGSPGSSALLLRRAFSLHRADPARGTIEVVFAERGAGTRELARLRPGDRLDVIAPLGVPFPVPERPGPAVLVGGGYGVAPLLPLARRLLDAGAPDVAFVCGAATRERLFGVAEARSLTGRVHLATDDGTRGARGRVTDLLPAAIEAVGASAVYACGPMGMLRAVTETARDHGVRAWTAVEEAMACGIGACMSCVLPVVGEDGTSRFVRACVEGPCFDGDTVRWDEVGMLPADLEGAEAMGLH
ncbi:dihydroorotate dehydrogenase electron transfer subunit [Streptomyces sp. NPDC001941]|uniref:dihydroorotate dehydrogenase electron transfer subunit n=1 Tax=Streptomyces sp. NPDC001941 TaxID=3154659 RepID=UPI003331F03B